MSESPDDRGAGGLVPLSEVMMEHLKPAHDAMIARRLEWWSQREIADARRRRAGAGCES